MAPHVVVVGGGLGGLAASIELAASGLLVDLVEAESTVGGKLGVAEVDGVEFDTGPSLLTLPWIFEAVFERAGTRIDDELTLFRPKPMHRYQWASGVELEVSSDLNETTRNVHDALGSKAAAEFRDFVTYAQRIWEAAAPQFLFAPAPSAHALTRLMVSPEGFGTLRSLRHIDPLRSMSTAIRRRVNSPHLRDIFERYATYNGSDPRSAPATLNCIAYVELGLGGYGIEGGIRELVRALQRAAESCGVRIRTGARVQSIGTHQDRVTGVTLETGEELPADFVVANADVAHVVANLLPRGQRRYRGWRNKPAPSMSGYNLVIRKQGASLAAHTVLFAERYMEEFVDIFDRGRPPQTPTVYCCSQTVAHRRKGWGNAEAVFVMANAPPAKKEAAAERWEPLKQQVLGRLAEHGLLGPEDEVVWERTPAQLAARFPGTEGALYGRASNGLLSAFQRPPNRSKLVSGLYYASGSVHPGGGMPLCIQSGRLAAQALIADAGLDQRGM